MKTLIDIREIGNNLELTYLNNYPIIKDGIIRYLGLIPLGISKGQIKLGVNIDEEVTKLEILIEKIPLTKELQDKALNKNNWQEVTTETGQVMLFPPDITRL